MLRRRSIALSLRSELTALVCRSLRECESGEVARGWLATQSFREKLAELAADNDRSLSDLESTGRPTVAILNWHELIHFELLADADADTKAFLLRAVSSPLVSRHFPHASIWKSYAEVLVGYVKKDPIALPVVKPKGYQKYFVPYLEFMTASDDASLDAARCAAQEGFRARNKDRRCVDWVGLDGDGNNPVKWDYRLFTWELALKSNSA